VLFVRLLMVLDFQKVGQCLKGLNAMDMVNGGIFNAVSASESCPIATDRDALMALRKLYL
jgi:hypothetical protein